MSDWALAIAAWVIQDGNYPDFRRGQRLEVAVEFYAPDPHTVVEAGEPNAVGDGEGWYSIEGTVATVLDRIWVIDCGILVYGEHAPDGAAVGDGVQGRVSLSVDHYLYFDHWRNDPPCRS